MLVFEKNTSIFLAFFYKKYHNILIVNILKNKMINKCQKMYFFFQKKRYTFAFHKKYNKMKELKKIIFILFALSNCLQLRAQFVENNPCTAICLDLNRNSMSGRTPAANLTSPNLNLPCGAGTTEDNPIWFVFRPSGSSFSFSFSSTNYSINGSTGLQVTLWEGSSCGIISPVTCQVGISGTLVATTTPYSVYYIQFDGLAEQQCDLVFSYDKAQLAGSGAVSAGSISGPKQICKNVDAQYCAAANFTAPDYKWTLSPSSAGTITKISGQPECAKVRITNPPANGKVEVCVEPVFTGKCPQPTQRICYTVDVYDLKPATCKVDICAEQRPFAYDLVSCIRTTNPTFSGTVTPSTFSINLPPGTKKLQNIPYTVDGAGCGNSVNLDMQVLDNKTVTLSPLLLCEGDIQNIKGTSFTCADASPSWRLFVTNGAPKPTQCDSNFKMLVQCLKINPRITGIGALDCSTTQLTLNAASSTTLPNNINNSIFQGIGTRQYAWSKNGVLMPNSTAATLLVTSPGLYGVTLTYTYQVTQIINNQQVIVIKTCSKTTAAQISGSANTAVAETPVASSIPCINGIAVYSVTPDPNAQSYLWTVTNGAMILGTATNPSHLNVKNNGLPYEVCLIKMACGLTSAPTCISITPTAAPVKPIIIGKSPVCVGDSALYRVDNAHVYSNSVAYKWTVTNGAITSFSSDSSQVYIKWMNAVGIGKIKVKVTEPCGMSLDSINVVINSCTTRNAGKMALKFILTAKLSKTITAKHQAGTEMFLAGDTFAYVLHEGSSNKIIQQIAMNKTGTFAFNSTKMFCNRIYYVSYIVGKETNGFPCMLDTCLSVVPQGQAIAWLCPIKTPTAQARASSLSQNLDYQINIYPNPVEERFFIEISNVQNTEFDLYNMQGQLLLSQKEVVPYGKNQYEISVAHLPKGIYLLKMKLDDKIDIRKIMVE